MSKPLTLWDCGEDGWSARYPGAVNGDEYRALPAAEFDKMVSERETARTLLGAVTPADDFPLDASTLGELEPLAAEVARFLREIAFRGADEKDRRIAESFAGEIEAAQVEAELGRDKARGMHAYAMTSGSHTVAVLAASDEEAWRVGASRLCAMAAHDGDCLGELVMLVRDDTPDPGHYLLQRTDAAIDALDTKGH